VSPKEFRNILKQKAKAHPRRDAELEESEIIVSRQYVIEGSDPIEVVTVKIGKPVLRASDGMYECATEIRENGQTWVRRLNGVDALEALQLALILVGTDLNYLSQQPSVRLSWLEGRRRDLALPTPPDFSLETIMTPEKGPQTGIADTPKRRRKNISKKKAPKRQ
jgi:hypothetical protein